MKAMSTTLSDILKSLMQALRVSSIFPASFFVAFNCLLILPNFTTLDFTDPSTITLIVTAVLALSYLLYAFNAPLIRLIEGYPFRLEWLGSCLSKCQRKRYQRYRSELVLATEMINDIVDQQMFLVDKYNLTKPEENEDYQRLQRWKRRWQVRQSVARQSLYYHYPYPADKHADVLPTLMGNTIASFESYAHNRYGIDAVIMWPRLVPVLQGEDYAPFVENEKTVFDFLLNLSFLVFVLAIETCWLFTPNNLITGTVFFFSLGGLAYLIYRAAVIGAVNWGATVGVAFDLYRGHLRKALRVREPVSLDQEKEIWKELSEFYIDGTPFGHFVYEEEPESDPPPKQDRDRTSEQKGNETQRYAPDSGTAERFIGEGAVENL